MRKMPMRFWLAPFLMCACSAVAEGPVLRTVYFIPTDRKPEPDFQARLDRVMTEVQRFYKNGMEQNGYAGMGFALDRDEKGALRILEVNGQLPMREYGRNDSGKVRREVKDALAKQGVDIDRETIVIFQLLLAWQDGKATEIGPFVGAGTPRYGTAWVYDDARLDAALLASKEPGGYYNHNPCSLGQFNTHYIGGVAHELGHAFGLPHDCQREAETAAKGNSLMGSGNHVYGRDLRGQGKGAFLSEASALPLSLHPLFTGKRVDAPPVSCRLSALKAAFNDGSIALDGQLEGTTMAKGIVALNTLLGIPGDYHAVGWTCPVREDGRFRLAMGELKPGDYSLRLRAFGPAGDAKTFEFRYHVDQQGVPDLTPFDEAIWLQSAYDAFKAKDGARLKAILAEIQKAHKADTQAFRKVAHMEELLSPPPPAALASVTANAVLLGDVAFEPASSVGWGSPLRNQVVADDSGCLLEVGGTFFASGLYAHAPASHAYRLNGKWKTFSTKYGLQDGHGGSVVFVIKGDGKELFRSEVTRDHTVREQQVPVSGVQQLELIVEDAGDGPNSDWGVWLEPRLQR